jgi:hypothetical protein
MESGTDVAPFKILGQKWIFYCFRSCKNVSAVLSLPNKVYNSICSNKTSCEEVAFVGGHFEKKIRFHTWAAGDRGLAPADGQKITPVLRAFIRAAEEPALPLQHLRQGVRHREQPQDTHRQGTPVYL